MKELRILYLEDSPYDADMVQRTLQDAGISFTLKQVDKYEEFKSALHNYYPDVILSDHSMYQFNSLQALKMFKEQELDIPFILVTGTMSEEFAVTILKEGADDYLLKENLVRLPNAIVNSLEKYRLQREKQQFINSIVTKEALMVEAEQLALFGSWEANVTDGHVTWSDGMFHILGYDTNEVKPGHDIILYHLHPEDRALYQQAIYSYLLSNDTYNSELRIIDRNTQLKFVSVKIVVTRDSLGRLIRLLGFMQDISQRRNLEKELAAQAVRQQKLITETTIQAQEKERNQLGRELHDNINQVLTSVKMFLTISVDQPDRREEMIQRSIQNINNSIDEIRKLSRSLVTPSLGDVSLSDALEELTSEMSLGNNLDVRLSMDIKDDKNIDKNIALMLYRIAQEQLNNIFKYAKAKKVEIGVTSTDNTIFFRVADDGVGFDASKKAYGIGLKNISSRVDFYSGQMKIVASPGQGCIIEITIPY